MKNIKVIIAFVLGILVSGLGVYALNINARDTAYDNTNSGSSATNMQDAIDDLYEKSGSGNKEVLFAAGYWSNTMEMDVFFLNNNGIYASIHDTINNNWASVINTCNTLGLEYIGLETATDGGYKYFLVKAKKSGTYVVYGTQSKFSFERYFNVGDTIVEFSEYLPSGHNSVRNTPIMVAAK